MKRTTSAMLAWAVCTLAAAQATYRIPNGLVKPAPADDAIPSRSLPGGPPAVTPVNQAPVGGYSPPLPSLSSPPLAPLPERGRGAGAGGADAAREELERYTTTAVVGEYAVLRTNVGAARAPDAAVQANASPIGQPAAQGSDRLAPPLQQVMRVHSGFQVMVAGVPLVPTVTPFGVDFRLPGATATLCSVSVESRSTDSRAVPTAQKEALDPAVATRTAPLPTGQVVQRTGPESGNPGGNSAAGTH